MSRENQNQYENELEYLENEASKLIDYIFGSEKREVTIHDLQEILSERCERCGSKLKEEWREIEGRDISGYRCIKCEKSANLKEEHIALKLADEILTKQNKEARIERAKKLKADIALFNH